MRLRGKARQSNPGGFTGVILLHLLRFLRVFSLALCRAVLVHRPFKTTTAHE